MDRIPVEDVNILTLLRITQAYSSSPLDAFHHILEIAKKSSRELPVQFAKVDSDAARDELRNVREVCREIDGLFADLELKLEGLIR